MIAAALPSVAGGLTLHEAAGLLVLVMLGLAALAWVAIQFGGASDDWREAAHGFHARQLT